MIIGMYLKASPVKLDTAVNGQEAMEKFKTGKYDLVLMDMQMPVMDGREAAAKIRAWEKERGVPAVPIMAFTASALKEEIDKALAAGCDYLQKPVNKELLRVRLRVAQRILKLDMDVDALSKLIPVCSHCRRVRRDDQAYVSLEAYISKNSDFQFSHGICPECLKKHYPQFS
ncbi:MAG: response regulator [Elusimicrobia bacterium]|nr:response regulator [Elusimicrobiota bacterium]